MKNEKKAATTAGLHIQKNEVFPGRPTLVFLHDSLGCITLWRNFPARLAEQCQCNLLIYDRLSYGQAAPFAQTERQNDYMETEADVLSELLKEESIEQAILFGHSDGGTIALLAAAKHPERIAAIITEGAHVFVEEITLEGIRQAVEAYKTTNLKQRLQKYHGDKTEAVFHAWADTWLRPGFRDWNIEHFLPQISCPALIIQGEKDEYGSLKQVESIVSHTKGPAQQLIIPGIGHTPHKEAIELILEKAVAFTQKLL